MRIAEVAVLLSRHPNHLVRWVRALRIGHKRLRRNHGPTGRHACLDLSQADVDLLRRALAGELGTLAQLERLSTLANGDLVPSAPWKSARWHGR